MFKITREKIGEYTVVTYHLDVSGWPRPLRRLLFWVLMRVKDITNG
jgi:hypothetical protein